MSSTLETAAMLASASPRRRQLLEDAGVAFRVHVADADEALDDEHKTSIYIIMDYESEIPDEV